VDALGVTLLPLLLPDAERLLQLIQPCPPSRTS